MNLYKFFVTFSLFLIIGYYYEFKFLLNELIFRVILEYFRYRIYIDNLLSNVKMLLKYFEIFLNLSNKVFCVYYFEYFIAIDYSAFQVILNLFYKMNFFFISFFCFLPMMLRAMDPIRI